MTSVDEKKSLFSTNFHPYFKSWVINESKLVSQDFDVIKGCAEIA